MKLKSFSREEMMSFLLDGVPLPESASTNAETIKFYFDELADFINLAENNFRAVISNILEISVSFGNIESIVLRPIEQKVVLLMAQELWDDVDNMTESEAEDIIGLIYGVIVFNEKWMELMDLALKINSNLNHSNDASVKKIDPYFFNKYNEIPNQKLSLKMKNLKSFLKTNKKYK